MRYHQATTRGSLVIKVSDRGWHDMSSSPLPIKPALKRSDAREICRNSNVVPLVWRNIRINLENNDYEDFDSFYQQNNISSDDEYCNILRAGIKRPRVFIKREPKSHFLPSLVWKVVALSKLARPDKMETSPTLIMVNMLGQRPQQRSVVSDLGFVDCVLRALRNSDRHTKAEQQLQVTNSHLELEKIKLQQIELQETMTEGQTTQQNLKGETNCLENLIKSVKALTIQIPTKAENVGLIFQSLERSFKVKNVPDDLKLEILSNILDNCNESIRNLTVLGLEINQLSELIIINHCTSKLHEEIIHRWELTLKQDTCPTLQAFRMFIESEVRLLGLLSGSSEAPKNETRNE
ncbi:ATP-dependent DNA helicase [Trichonephila clavipes]|uniref:ATP-dependent DNA helicase n=1 Tax=Trichonephila clavipes TaxID=2585209 RepID=A0A8X6SZM0_TRICX|nr:ATP-dependent DNA helicase [Trichonephila clavipes]